MRDPARINRVIELLRSYWHQYPDMRLGQLVHYLAEKDEERQDIKSISSDGYYMEDEELEQTLRELLREIHR